MSTPDTKADELLRTLGKEVIKVHRQYDGSNRLIIQHEALANTIHAGPALRTDYQYVGVTTDVLKMRESMSAWDSSWDI